MADTEELTDEQRTLAEKAAKDPETVWKLLCKQSPRGLMQKVELMMRGGATPEWIMNRRDFFKVPVEIQTVVLNAMHWRQAEMRRERN